MRGVQRTDAHVNRLFVMRPHAKHANNTLLRKDFIHETMLDVDAPRIGTGQIADQLFVRRRSLKRIGGEHSEQFQRFWLQAGGSQLLRVLLRMLREDDLPTHHLSALALLPKGSAMPALIDSRMPGTASRYSVS